MRHLRSLSFLSVLILAIGLMPGCTADAPSVDDEPVRQPIVTNDVPMISSDDMLVETDTAAVAQNSVRVTSPPIPTSQLTVRVIDGDYEQPLDYAAVRLEPVTGGDAIGGMSIGGGSAIFPGIFAGEYILRVSYLGFEPETTALKITGENAEVEARLKRSDASVKTFDAFTVTADAIMVEVKDTETVYTIDTDSRGRGLAAGARTKRGGNDLVALPPPSVPIEAGTEARVEEAIGRQSGQVTRMSKLQIADTLPENFGGPRMRAPGTPTIPRTEDPRLLASSSIDEVWILVRGKKHRPAGPPIATPGGPRAPRCGTILVEDPTHGDVAIPLESTDVTARIDGYVSSVDVRQRFHNPFDRTIEAEYVFPLPHDAAVNDFVMVVGERRIRGIIREREEAKRIYENARRQGFKASLLEQERPNVFRQKVANIEPNERIDVELHFFGKLPYVDGAFEFAFPLVVGPRFNPLDAKNPIVPVSFARRAPANEGGVHTTHLEPGQTSRHRVMMTVELDAGVEIEDLRSGSHVVRIEREGASRAHVVLSPHDTLPNKDFVLRYRVASDTVKSDAIVHRAEDGSKYFSLMLVPPADLASLDRAPTEFVFVVDCSGSMRGWPMEQAKAAMRRALRQLRPDDTFQVIRFSESASALGGAPLAATTENVERGLRYVDGLHGSGGTMMIEGVKSALDFPHTDDRLRIVSFMTDGFIGNEDEIFGAIAARIDGSRIFSFGVGSSVNRHLLEGMARIGRGAVAYVGSGGDDIEVVDAFYDRVRHPAMTDVEIDWGGMQVASVYPIRTPDLFVGRPILLHGAFRGDGRTTIEVTGRAGGRDVAFEIPVDLDDDVDRPALPLLWARTRIQDLTDRLAIDPKPHMQDEGLQLALGHNLMSPWTSFVAVDGSRRVDDPAGTTVPVPTPMPEGVDYETTVGRNR